MGTAKKVATGVFANPIFYSKTPCFIGFTIAFTSFVACSLVHFCISFMNGQIKSFILWIICLTLFILHQCLEKIAKVRIELLDNYLDPLLIMPILLPLITWERRFLRNEWDYKLPLTHVLGYVIIISALAEIILPKLTKNMIADPLDVLFYSIGAGIYLLTQLPVKTGITKVQN